MHSRLRALGAVLLLAIFGFAQAAALPIPAPLAGLETQAVLSAADELDGRDTLRPKPLHLRASVEAAVFGGEPERVKPGSQPVLLARPALDLLEPGPTRPAPVAASAATRPSIFGRFGNRGPPGSA